MHAHRVCAYTAKWRFPVRAVCSCTRRRCPGDSELAIWVSTAFEFIEWLTAAGQHLWQVLPLGPTGYGNSPYQSFSAFAGNPLLISLDELIADGLLTAVACSQEAFAEGDVDFSAVIAHRQALWPRVLDRFDQAAPAAVRDRFERFCVKNAAWLGDYALFMAIKAAHDQTTWTDVGTRDRAARAVGDYAMDGPLCARDPAAPIDQFLFFEQWQRVRDVCHSRGIVIMGDLPIFVAHDSADVWARRELFRLDPDGTPTVVAGVPPDYFSATGQLWGNPHYRWDLLERSGYAWWIERCRSLLDLVDRVRIDHFRGFEASWEVPRGATTAMYGEWVKAPGAQLFEVMQSALGVDQLPFVAENLGVITPEVEALRERFGLPGMAILQFAFGTDPQAPDFKPHNYPRNRVVYTGTHDNDTTVGWWTGDAGHSTRSEKDIEHEREHACRYLGLNGQDVHWAFIRAVLASVADTAIVPAQDLLGLGSEARMNRPGTMTGNWRWRLRPGQLTADVAQRLAEMAATYDRI